MLTKETILAHTLALKTHNGTLNSRPGEGEVWRVKQAGVSFELTRFGGLIPDVGLDLLSLHIKGNGSERVVKEFTDAYGCEPLAHFPARKARQFDSYKWDISRIPELVSQNSNPSPEEPLTH